MALHGLGCHAGKGTGTPGTPTLGCMKTGSLRPMKKIIVLLVIAAFAAVAWKVLTAEVDADPAQ